MSIKIKIGLAVGVVILCAGAAFVYYQYLGKQAEPAANLPGISPLPQGVSFGSLTPSVPPVSVDELLDSILADSAFESGLAEEEFSDLNQSLFSESQAISEFGQSYDQNEL